MSGRGDILFAFFAAASVHIGFLAVSPSDSGGRGGELGADRISVSVASPGISAMVQDWDSSPEFHDVQTFARVEARSEDPVFSTNAETLPVRVSQPERTPSVTPPRVTVPVLTAAPSQTAPALQETRPTVEIQSTPKALRLAVPSLEPAPEQGALPATEITAPPPDTAPRLTERPTPRPSGSTRQEAVTRRVAAGTGKGANRGLSLESPAPRASDAARRSATAAWAAAIQKSIAHHHIYPRGTNDEGRVRVAMVVLPNGALARVSIARSSGSAALDRAAVIAVKRAAPFPPAPKGLDDQWYDIGQWISFEKR